MDRYNETLKEKSRTHFDIKCSKFFFDPPLRIMKNKTKINKWDLINLKAFSQQRKPSVKEKDNPQNGKNSCKRRTHTNNLHSSISKNKQPNKKLAKDLNADFSKDVMLCCAVLC